MKGMTVPARMLVAMLLLLLADATSGAERRVALVVGNGDYAHTPVLRNPANDATDVAAALRNLGFAVIEGVDLDRNAFEAKLREFAGEARNAETALLFYAGHGMQVDGENYLLPVDARLTEELDLDFEALGLRTFLRQMRSSVNLVFLDACRDNPLARDLARSMGAGRSAAIGRGLGRVDSGSGTLIAYATQPGSIAADGEGRNSPFTTALLRHIAVPGRSVNDMLTAVTSDVATATESRQQPWVHSSLLRPFHFVPPSSAGPSVAADGGSPSGTQSLAAGGSSSRLKAEQLAAERLAMEEELLFWETVKDSEDPADLEAYRQRFPGGRFEVLASNRLKRLKQTMGSENSSGTGPPRKGETEELADGDTDAEWQSVVRAIKGHSAGVRSIALSKDSRTLASGADDGTVRVWDVGNGGLLRVLKGHARSVRSVALSPSGLTLASGADDGTIRIWDVGGGAWRVLKGHTAWVRSVAFSPDGQTLASGADDGTIRVWDIGTGSELRVLRGRQTRWIRSVAFSPDGSTLASGSDDGTVRVWDAGNGGLLRVLRGHSRSVRSVAFSPDGSMLASGSDDDTVRVWDVGSGDLLRILEGHAGDVVNVAFSPDGRTLASGSGDESVRLWDVPSGKLLRVLKGHTGNVLIVAFSPSGQVLARGSVHGRAVELKIQR